MTDIEDMDGVTPPDGNADGDQIDQDVQWLAAQAHEICCGADALRFVLDSLRQSGATKDINERRKLNDALAAADYLSGRVYTHISKVEARLGDMKIDTSGREVTQVHVTHKM